MPKKPPLYLYCPTNVWCSCHYSARPDYDDYLSSCQDCPSLYTMTQLSGQYGWKKYVITSPGERDGRNDKDSRWSGMEIADKNCIIIYIKKLNQFSILPNSNRNIERR